MKTIFRRFSVVFMLCSITFGTQAQNDSSSDFEFKVDRILKPLSISPRILADANTIKDLNKHYPESWVKSYESVEISARVNGESQTSISLNDQLTDEQKKLIAMADSGSDIAVMIKYIPNNDLRDKEIKAYPFSFMVNPNQDASFKGGYKALLEYLKKNAIDKVPEDTFTGFIVAIIKFTIAQNGQVINSHVFESSKDSEADKILIEAINKMPSWNAAEYTNGTKAKQEFAFTVGNMKNCIINVLNIDEGIE